MCVIELLFYHRPLFIYYAHNLPACLADHCHIMTSEVLLLCSNNCADLFVEIFVMLWICRQFIGGED